MSKIIVIHIIFNFINMPMVFENTVGNTTTASANETLETTIKSSTNNQTDSPTTTNLFSNATDSNQTSSTEISITTTINSNASTTNNASESSVNPEIESSGDNNGSVTITIDKENITSQDNANESTTYYNNSTEFSISSTHFTDSTSLEITSSIRYTTQQSSSSNHSSSATIPKQKSPKTIFLIIIIVAGGSIIVIFLLIGCCLCCCWKKKAKDANIVEEENKEKSEADPINPIPLIKTPKTEESIEKSIPEYKTEEISTQEVVEKKDDQEMTLIQDIPLILDNVKQPIIENNAPEMLFNKSELELKKPKSKVVVELPNLTKPKVLIDITPNPVPLIKKPEEIKPKVQIIDTLLYEEDRKESSVERKSSSLIGRKGSSLEGIKIGKSSLESNNHRINGKNEHHKPTAERTRLKTISDESIIRNNQSID